jgi:hypothetical protein
LKIAQVAQRLVGLAAHASLTIDLHAHVAKMAEPLVHGAQMIVHRVQEVLMSARPVEVDLHSGDQQKVVGAQVREEVDRQRAVVVQAKVVVVQAMVVVVQHSGDQQKVAVGRSVMMIVR